MPTSVPATSVPPSVCVLFCWRDYCLGQRPVETTDHYWNRMEMEMSKLSCTCTCIPYSGLFLWGAKFRYFCGQPRGHENFH